LPPLATFEPKPGRLVLFPSFLFHGTRPFKGGERLTVAFDLVPVAQTGEAEDAAQAAPAPVAEKTDEADDSSAIVVTGSRIRRPNLESTNPITSVGGESLLKQGQNNVGEALNELPQLRTSVAQSNPGLGVGVAGLNLLDLRGLGTVRTLVLVNGRRHVASDILNNAVSPDVNTIPTDLIDRVDIVTGGNSAIYGSDAIAGVVNFVLKRNFEGLQVRGQGAISKGNVGGNQYVSAMYGHNFADDQANITVHGEFFNQERIYGSDLPWLKSVNGLVVTDVDAGGAPNGSDGIPDRTFVRDIRSSTIHRFGLIPITQDSNPAVANPACGRGIAAGAPSSGSAYSCTYIFDEQGNLSAQTGSRFGQGPTGSIAGGNGQTGREGKILSIIPEMQRYNFNALGHYTASDALEAFFEAKFVRVDAQGSNAGPSFIQGQQTQFDSRERIRLDNPYLSDAEQTFISGAILASGCRVGLTAVCNSAAAPASNGRLTAADVTAINNGSYRFVLGRQLTDAGMRDEKFQRDTYRLVGGLRGTFNEDWNYEVSANLGKFKEKTTTFGYLDRQRFLLSIDSADQGEVLTGTPNGNIVCRSQVSPAAAVAFTPTGAARLAADIAACRPYNPFGAQDNSAAVDYFSYDATNHASLRQFIINGFVSGDASQLFELPGGPIRFALGAEYRNEKATYKNDPFIVEGATNAVTIGLFDPPSFEVKEAFAEIQLPILANTPFFDELTLSGAARVADYKGSVGTVWAYNAGLDWAPIRDIRFRANYSRAVRAPNLSETGFPVVPNFAPGFVDPCSSGAIANNPNRTANCNSQFTPAQLALLTNGGYSLPILSGSNPDLDPETSDSYTVGAVIQPRFVPGLSVSVDWYKIKVKDVIVSLAAQTIANSCYDQPSLANPFCSLFERNGGTATPATSPGGVTQPYHILANSLLSAGFNFASRERRGIDVDVSYRTNLGDFAKLNTNLVYTHNLKISNFENPTLPDFENRILGELGDPKDEFLWDVDLTKGPVTLGYQMRYIGPMWTGAYEDFNELSGACSSSGCPPFNADFADIRKYPATFYHNVRLEWDVDSIHGIGHDYEFYAGVDNLLNTHPPLGLAGTGTGGITDRGTGNAAIYDVRGRTFYAGFKAAF
jgi:outer membrane receptor protein involved in Fe transport